MHGQEALHGVQKVNWLPLMELNHHFQLQRLGCYHYKPSGNKDAVLYEAHQMHRSKGDWTHSLNSINWCKRRVLPPLHSSGKSRVPVFDGFACIEIGVSSGNRTLHGSLHRRRNYHCSIDTIKWHGVGVSNPTQSVLETNLHSQRALRMNASRCLLRVRDETYGVHRILITGKLVRPKGVEPL